MPIKSELGQVLEKYEKKPRGLMLTCNIINFLFKLSCKFEYFNPLFIQSGLQEL